MTKQRVLGILAMLGLAALLVGMPILLVAAHPIGLPHLTWTWEGLRQALLTPDDGTLAVTLFKVVGWITWAILTAAVLLEIVGIIGRHPVPQLRPLRIPQTIAHQLVATALAAFTVAGPIVGAAAPALAHPDTPVPTRVVGRPAEREPTHRQPPRTVTVQRGDTLSQIALDATGRAANYPKLFDASKQTGSQMADT